MGCLRLINDYHDVRENSVVCRARTSKRTERTEKREREAGNQKGEMTCRMSGRRVKGGFARYAALDPPDRRGGREEGVKG
ncbi:hypothetical protein ACVWY5_000122 [Bradyrhizobium sp. USDA 3256]